MYQFLTSVLTRLSPRIGALLALTMLVANGAYFNVPTAQAQVNGPDCNAPFGIVETLPEGSKWELCWGYGPNRGVYFYNVYFTPDGGRRTKVIADAWIAQIQVAYDNNEARFHDVTGQFLGLGGVYHRELSNAECPGGSVLSDAGNDLVCKRTVRRPFGYTSTMPAASGRVRQEGHYLELFSVSQTGQYAYIPIWRLYGDGTIELLMGASGQLEKILTESVEYANCEDGVRDQFTTREECLVDVINIQREGWLLDANDTYGVSHTHNYFWRIDFDLGVDDGNTDMLNVGRDDIVEQLDFVADATGTRRNKRITRIVRESALDASPNLMRSWRIRDPFLRNANGNLMAWHIEPSNNGHRFDGAVRTPACEAAGTCIEEEFQRGDVFVTRYKQCEMYASFNNLQNNNANCANFLRQTDFSGNEVGFVNGESIVGSDQVMYLKVSFHHTPRDEDQPNMHTHYNSIKIVPRNVTDANPLANAAPTINLTKDVVDQNVYGHTYGTGKNYSSLSATFNASGNDMMLTFDAYDLDSESELYVRLNGQVVGWVRAGRNNARSIRRAQLYLPRELQTNAGAVGEVNTIEILQRRPGDTWGVGRLVVRDAVGTAVTLAPGQQDNGQFGYRYGANTHPEIIPIEFAGDGSDKTVYFRGFDIDSTREAMVFVNGRLRYFVGAGSNNGFTSYQRFDIDAAELPYSLNRVVIVQSEYREAWGATQIRLINR